MFVQTDATLDVILDLEQQMDLYFQVLIYFKYIHNNYHTKIKLLFIFEIALIKYVLLLSDAI